MSRRSICVCVLALFFVAACGGPSKVPAAAPASSDDAQSSSEGSGGSSDSAAGASTDTSSSSSSASSAAGDAQGPVTCTANGVCTELPFSGQEATDAKDRCKGAGGDPRDGVCNHDDVAATCFIEAKQVTMYFYENKNQSKEWMRGFLKGGEDACSQASGAFKRTSATGRKGGRGGGGAGGGGKPKPKKKKK